MEAMVLAINNVLPIGRGCYINHLLKEGELIIKWMPKIQNKANACIIV